MFVFTVVPNPNCNHQFSRLHSPVRSGPLPTLLFPLSTNLQQCLAHRRWSVNLHWVNEYCTSLTLCQIIVTLTGHYHVAQIQGASFRAGVQSVSRAIEGCIGCNDLSLFSTLQTCWLDPGEGHWCGQVFLSTLLSLSWVFFPHQFGVWGRQLLS